MLEDRFYQNRIGSAIPYTRADILLVESRFFQEQTLKGRILHEFIFSSPQHEVLMVSYCDWSVSVVHNLL